MKIVVSIMAATAALSFAAPAAAHWQYTKFGMTPQQVVEASGGMAHAGDGAASAQQDGSTSDVVGSFDPGGRPFTVKFYFQSGLLDHVVLESNDGQACVQTARDLQANYGGPIDVNENPAAGSAVWLDRLKGNRIKLVLVGHVYCEVQYSPLASAAASQF